MKKKILASMLALLTAFSCFSFTSVSAMAASKKVQNSRVALVQKNHNGKTSDKNKLSQKKQKITLKVGSSHTVKVHAPSGITIVWTSSDTNVATVTDGKIVAVNAGSCTVTAALSNGKSTTYAVTVKSVTDKTKFRLTKQNVTLTVGGSCPISAVVPSGTASQTITWNSSDANIATMSDGKIVAAGVGSCKITATLSDNETAACTVTVISATDVDKVHLSKNKVSLIAGKSCTIKAIVTPATAVDKTVTWASSDTNIATVSDGKITAIGAGTCTITASTSNGKSATCTVTVKSVTDATKIHLSKNKVRLSIGKSCTIKAKLTPKAAANQTFTWVSSDTNVATVTDGKVVAIGVGTCTITASTSDGKSAVCKITVKAASSKSAKHDSGKNKNAN